MNEQILIVEDETDVAALLRYNLKKSNYRTITAQSGEEAVEAARLHTIDAVLLDIMLPGLNGWEVCRILRESPNGKSVPIIMLSALTDEEARIRGLSLGADDYLTKPFSVRELLLKIRKNIDRQQTVDQLRVREQGNDTSLRYLVHELKNAVSIIGNFSSIALRKDHPANYLKTINITAHHAESLLNDASLLARLEKEGGPFPLASVDLADMAAEASEMFRDAAAERGIEIVFVNKTGFPVLGSRTALRQVLVNLVSNAVKYNRDNGKVYIHMDDRDKWVDISITDEGCGIRRDELSRVFEKFYRAAGSERIKGAGLGLYIVKLLTEAMGGKITIASNPGAGSTFTLSLQKLHTSVQGESMPDGMLISSTHPE